MDLLTHADSTGQAPDALVLLSGGQDSTTCLYWALERFAPATVEAVCFDYGQRHRAELDCAASIARQVDVPLTVLPIDTFSALGGNALLDSQQRIKEGVGDELPNTFVPGRNLIFLTFAAALAVRKDIRHLVTGVAQADYSGYPDCRQQTMSAMQSALCLGMDNDITIHTPLMFLTKAQTVMLARGLGALPAMQLTMTCYEGQQPPCGCCPACVLRAKGFAEAGIEDPLHCDVPGREC